MRNEHLQCKFAVLTILTISTLDKYCEVRIFVSLVFNGTSTQEGQFVTTAGG